MSEGYPLESDDEDFEDEFNEYDDFMQKKMKVK